jgi:hypothetical protein
MMEEIEERNMYKCQVFILALFIAVAGLALSPLSSHADDIGDLRAEIQQLKQLVNSLEQRLDAEEKAREEVSRCALNAEKRAESSESSVTELSQRLEGMKEGTYPVAAGLSIGAGITMVGQGTAGADGAIGEDPIDGSISADIEIDSQLCEGSEAFLLIEAGAGGGITDELFCFWGVNDDAGDTGSFLELTEAWYEQRLFGERLAITVGKLDLSNYFDTSEYASDETAQFLSSGFVGNIAIDFPDNGPGIRLSASPSDYVSLGIGVQEGDADWEDITEHPFAIAEVDLHIVPGGHYSMYGWLNGTDHVEFMDPASVDKSGWGAGLSMDQAILDWLGVFGRVGYRDGSVYEFDLAWSVGLGVSGGPWGRESDTFGVGWGMAHLSSDYKASGLAPVNTGDEGHLEAYYRIYVNEHLELTPNIQLITNALGDRDFGEAVAIALRAQVSL